MQPTILAVLAVVGLVIVLLIIQRITKLMSSARDPLKIWDGLSHSGLVPMRLRGWIFSTILGFANPYSRSINFRITELRKGTACGVMRVRL